MCTLLLLTATTAAAAATTTIRTRTITARIIMKQKKINKTFFSKAQVSCER